MDITILCTGSRGDFQPYIALAQELQKLGLAVTIVGGKSFEGLIKGYGIGFYELSVDYQTADIDPDMLKDAQSSDNPLKMLLTFNKMKKYVVGLTSEMFDACEGSELYNLPSRRRYRILCGKHFGDTVCFSVPFPHAQDKGIRFNNRIRAL